MKGLAVRVCGEVASIRLEDEARKDPRFTVLGKRLGTSKFDARARMEELWAYCTEKQTYYLTAEIIDVLAEHEGFHQALVEADLAEHSERGYRIKGTRGRIEWLKKIKQGAKSGGKARIAKAKRNPNGTLQPSTSPMSSPQPAPDPGQSSALTLTLSPAPTLVKEKKNTETGALAIASAPSLPVPKASKFSDTTRHKMRAFIDAYVQAYKAKYHGAPEGIRDKALIGKLGHWIESVSQERAVELVQVYMQIDWRPINDSQHDLWQFFRHLNRIGNALNTGQAEGQINWAKVFA